MRKTDLERRLRDMARKMGVDFEMVRQGRGHEIHRFGGYQFTIPRHAEINEMTARGILRACEKEGR